MLLVGPPSSTPAPYCAAMTILTTDAPLLQLTDDARTRPLPTAIHEARSVLPAIVDDVLAIPESALAKPWAWIGGSEEEVRYGPYRVHELFELAQIDATRLGGPDGGRAAALAAPATAARWDLHGLLAPLTDPELDADPGDGEWTIRLTLGHTVSGQRGYAWGSAWWLSERYALDDPNLPATAAGDAYWAALPDEATVECAGTLGDIRARLDAILDLSAERLAGTPDELLVVGARWSGFAVPVAHRITRWASHLREHTIQVEKTLVMIGRAPTEPERLARLALAAYGRAEQVVFGRTGPEAEAAAALVRDAAMEARDTIASARATAVSG